MNELALFAGGGGGILASTLLGIRTICAVEHSASAQRLLVRRQNEGILEPFAIWDDVRTFDGKPWEGVAGIVSGGFPCQAFSTAAAGRNVADNLWPEMARVVADVSPWYVFAENVSWQAIERAAEDCRAMGYRTSAIALGAGDLGGDHVRRRYWLLAYADDKSQLRRAINAEVALGSLLRHGIWQAQPDEPGMADGMADRVDRYTAIGNGQVPVVAAAALCILALD